LANRLSNKLVGRFREEPVRIAAAALIAIVLLAILGMPSVTAQSPVSVAGAWEGIVQRAGAGGGGRTQIFFDLEQNGNTVTGSYYTLGGFAGTMSKVEVKGTFDGEKLSLAMPSVAFGYINATIKDNRMEGELRGRSGTFQTISVTRRGP
jgi:hypothetical protein